MKVTNYHVLRYTILNTSEVLKMSDLDKKTKNLIKQALAKA